MSHFYGTLQGARGEATRLANKKSGLVTHAAGWQGAIRVDVRHDDEGKDRYRVQLVPWKGSGGTSRVLAEGILDSKESA